MKRPITRNVELFSSLLYVQLYEFHKWMAILTKLTID